MLQKSKILYKWSWLLLIILSLMYFSTLMYGDLPITFRRGLAFIDACVSGNFPGNYSFESSFYIPVHILFGIWGLPCWILCRMGLTTSDSVICLLWAKLLCVIFYAVCILYTGKVLKKCEVRNVEFWLFLLASSFVMFSPAMVTGSYDYIEVYIGLIGLLLAADEDRISIRTVLVLSVAVSVKTLFLLAALVILLLKEKRIIHILKDVILLLSVPLVFRVFAKWCASRVQSSKDAELVSMLQNRFLDNTVSIGIIGASVFVIAVILALSVAYLSPSKLRPGDFLKRAAWLSFAVYFSMFISVYSHPQWCVFLAPFMIVLAASNENRIKDSVLFALIFDSVFALLEVTTFIYSFLRDGVFSYLVLRNIPIVEKTSCFYDMLDQRNLIQYLPATDAVFIVCGFVLMAINNPWKPLHAENALTSVEERTCFTWARVYRLGFILAYFALNLYINYCI